MKSPDDDLKKEDYPKLENLTPVQERVVQKLLRSVLGPSTILENGDWLLEGVEVSLTNEGIVVENLICEQSGLPYDGMGKSLGELALATGLFTYSHSFRLDVTVDLLHLGAMTYSDIETLFARDIARDLAITAVVKASMPGADFVPSVAEKPLVDGELAAEVEDVLEN